MKRYARSLFALAALWLLVVPAHAALTTNSWTNSVSSVLNKWELGINWSLGVPPTNSHAAILITNVATKTVTIDATTVLTNAIKDCMTISNLTVRGFGAGINTLQLTNAGTVTPLRLINSLTIGTNAVLLVTNSAVQVDALSGGALIIDGKATLNTGSIVVTNSLTNSLTSVSSASSGGNLTVSNGTLLVDELRVADQVGAQGTFTMAGGTNTVFSDLKIGRLAAATGTVWMTGGRCTVTNRTTFVAGSGVAQMTISNGMVLSSVVILGNSPGSQGTLTIAGGTNTVSSNLVAGVAANATGTVAVTGGQLAITNAAGVATLVVGQSGRGVYTQDGGTVIVDKLVATNGANSVFNLNGGSLFTGASFFTNSGTLKVGAPGNSATLHFQGTTHSLSNALSLADAAGSTGTVWMTANELVVTNGDTTIGHSGVGQMTISNGTWRAREVFVSLIGNIFFSAEGTLTIAGGTNTLSSFLTIGASGPATGTVWVTGGQLVVTNNSTIIGSNGVGQVTQSGGTALFKNIVVGSAINSQGTLTVAGGTNTLSSFLNVGERPGSKGMVWLTGGDLVMMTGDAVVGDFGVGQMTVSNGTWRVLDVFVGYDALSQGTLTVAGGTNTLSSLLSVGELPSATGVVWVTGGQLVVANDETDVGYQGLGQMTVSNGTWRALKVFVGDLAGSQGALTIAGGTNTVSSSMILGNFACTSTGRVTVAGGRLFVTNASASAVLEVRSGSVTLNSGTLTIDNLVISNACGRFFHYGGTLLFGNTNGVLPNLDADGDGLPNGWEASFGLDAFNDTGINGASGDPDGDAFTNLQEFNNNTNPFIFNSPINSWTNPGSNKWETGANWSLTIPPASNQTVFVTNALTKTITIDATTTGALNGATMTIRNLTVQGFGAGINTLQLTNAGAATPLRILNNFTLGTNAVLVVTNSALFVSGISGGSFSVDGTVWLKGGELTMNFAAVGAFGVGQMTVSSGTWFAGQVIVGSSDGSQGTLTVAGGDNTVADGGLTIGNSAGATGAVWVTGGQLTMTASTYVGYSGVGQMTVSNGTWLPLRVHVGFDTGSQGTLTVAGGTSTLADSLNIGGYIDIDAQEVGYGDGMVWLTGGQLTVMNDTTYVGIIGGGQMTVSNGTWLARNVVVSYFGQGTLRVAGGTSSVFSNLTIGNFPCTPTGTVVVAGGNLFVTNATGNAVLEVRTGSLILNSGTLKIDQLVITNACGHFVRTGGTLIYGTAVLTSTRDDDGDGISNGYEQSHGLDPLNAADANIDSDGDGLSNLQEFLAGTDATNSTSAFRITAIARTNNDVRITWMTGSGKTNALERTAGVAGSFATNNFAAIFTVTNTVGSVTNYLDVGAATNTPSRYYRVRLVP